MEWIHRGFLCTKSSVLSERHRRKNRHQRWWMNGSNNKQQRRVINNPGAISSTWDHSTRGYGSFITIAALEEEISKTKVFISTIRDKANQRYAQTGDSTGCNGILVDLISTKYGRNSQQCCSDRGDSVEKCHFGGLFQWKTETQTENSSIYGS